VCETWFLTLRGQIEGVWEQSAKENILNKDRWSDKAGENWKMMSSTILTLRQKCYYWDDLVKVVMYRE
jgi:hypothetical protein